MFKNSFLKIKPEVFFSFLATTFGCNVFNFFMSNFCANLKSLHFS